MNNELYIDQLLDEYLSGKISLEEITGILHQRANIDVLGQIGLHQAAVVALQRSSVIKQVNSIHIQYAGSRKDEEMISTKRSGSLVFLKPVKWAISIAAVLILGLAAWLFYSYATLSSSTLYTEIYQPYNINTDRSLITEIEPHNMLQQYNDKDFKSVIATYNSLRAPSNREKFLAASAYHETGEYARAADLFTGILEFNRQHNSRLYNDEAEFFLGLNCLKMKKNKEALIIFEKIHNDADHTFNERINKTILKKLRWLR